MNKIKLSMLTAAMVLGLGGSQLNAQTNPCGWTLLSQVTEPNCFGSCDGAILITPSVNWPDFEYLWSDGSTSSFLNNVCAEDYMVTVTDNKKCTQVFTFSVPSPEQLVVACTTLTNESAPGAADGSIEANATGGWGSYTYEWQTVPAQSGPLASNLTAGTYTVIVYDGKNCTASTSCEIITEKQEECDGFRTQTQGGWGQCHQTGNNPGTYLFANFAAAFPNGLTLGCTRTLTLTSAQAVCDFLPSGTTPKVLPVGAALVNPGQSYRNVFAGQLAAAMLNAGFDAHDPNFAGNGTYTLGELEIVSGTFAGWTVNELIAEANRKIGGCASQYTPSQLSGALESVNENYKDGSIDNGFLTCPEEKKDRVATAGLLKLNVTPNPVSASTLININVENDGVLEVHVFNMAGQKAASLFKGEVKAGEIKALTLDASSLNSGVYFVKAITAEKIATQKIVVNK